MKLLIIRHGDPDYEHDTLTERGQKEAAALAERLKNEKIDYIYCSPLGRAQDTCKPTAKVKNMSFETFDYLKEFTPRIEWGGRTNAIAWDLLPTMWKDCPEMYTENWGEYPLYKGKTVEKEYKEVIEQFDGLIEKHGYKRKGMTYKAERSNKDCIAIFCHFGLECVLLSRLLDIPVTMLWHHFCGLPTSVTTVYTEERREGTAVFRCATFGDTTHLYAAGLEPSFAARFCETFDSPERHD